MSRRSEQIEFSKYLAILITYIYSCGYGVVIGDVYATDGHVDGSFHYKCLAADLNLISPDGVFLEKTQDHEKFGHFWENLHIKCTWGGRFDDGNHYSWGEVDR